jgi:hypothetical protein
MELAADEKLVIERYRQLKQDGFGSLAVVVHRHRLMKVERTVNEDIPASIREVDR